MSQQAKAEVAKAKNITLEVPKANLTQKVVSEPAPPPEKSVNDLISEGKSLAEVQTAI